MHPKKMNVEKLLEGSREVEFLPSGEMVPLGDGLAHGPKPKGVQLTATIFY